MRGISRLIGSILALATIVASFAEAGDQAHGPSQSAADVIRSITNADAAFIAAGHVKETCDPNDLATLLQYPSDDVALVSLKGSQIRLALERSVSIYPSPNTSFLQLSGMEVTFNKSAPAEKRIVSVTIGSRPLDDAKIYVVAMPGSLARGGMGYFKVWDRSQVKPTSKPMTLESILSGKKVVPSPSRWTIQ